MTVSIWRRPQLAPVYAAVLAFVAVAIAAVAFAPARVTVSVTGEVPPDLVVVAGSGPVRDGTASVAATVDQLCISAAEPVRVDSGGSPTDCVPVDTATITVRRVSVLVTPTTEVPLPADGQVTVAAGNGLEYEAGKLVDRRFTPARPLGGRLVCFQPPKGWAVTAPTRPGKGVQSCTTAPDSLTDVVFEVES